MRNIDSAFLYKLAFDRGGKLPHADREQATSKVRLKRQPDFKNAGKVILQKIVLIIGRDRLPHADGSKKGTKKALERAPLVFLIRLRIR